MSASGGANAPGTAKQSNNIDDMFQLGENNSYEDFKEFKRVLINHLNEVLRGQSREEAPGVCATRILRALQSL